MHILLVSAGGGGGNILRSVMTTFRRDLAVTKNTNPGYAERLRNAVTPRFLDTNEFALSDLPSEERFLIGARTTGRIGARHDPEVALRALEESRSEVEDLFSRYSIIVLVGTGGKGTGSGTMFPLAQIARQQRRLVIPIFVRPSFERHEVDKRHYDHAVRAIEQFDRAGIRLIEILNDRGYAEDDPQPQPVVWERMNVPIARGLRGLIYVLWDLSQVDPSDLSILFAGQGRLRIGFGEIVDALELADRVELLDEVTLNTQLAQAPAALLIDTTWTSWLADAHTAGHTTALIDRFGVVDAGRGQADLTAPNLAGLLPGIAGWLDALATNRERAS